MRRRDFMIAIGAGAIGWPAFGRAQQPKVPRIGVLLTASADLMGPYREALRDLGYVEGKNIHIEVRSAQGQTGRLPKLAAELVRDKVDIIVASLTPAVMAAKNATREIPIVMAPAGDPVGMGIVASLARPGGNITGYTGDAAQLAAKNLELIRELIPAAKRVAVLNNASDPFANRRFEQIQEGARVVRLDVRSLMVHGNDEMPRAFAAIAAERLDAVLLPGSLPVRPMIDLSLQHRLPLVATQKFQAKAGALAAYSVNFDERGREIAAYIDRILKGARPADLPVARPTTYELTINLKTAKVLGLTVSPILLNRADDVVE